MGNTKEKHTPMIGFIFGQNVVWSLKNDIGCTTNGDAGHDSFLQMASVDISKTIARNFKKIAVCIQEFDEKINPEGSRCLEKIKKCLESDGVEASYQIVSNEDIERQFDRIFDVYEELTSQELRSENSCRVIAMMNFAMG